MNIAKSSATSPRNCGVFHVAIGVKQPARNSYWQPSVESQKAMVSLANPLVGSTDIARTFSLARSPHDQGSIMIAMRMRFSEFKTTLLAAPNGTRFEVSRARGSFTLHQDPQRPAMFSH